MFKFLYSIWGAITPQARVETSTTGATWISSHLLPRDAVQLGHLVLSIKSPEMDFHSPSSTLFAHEDKNVVTQRLESFQDVSHQSKDTNFGALLSSLLTVSRGIKSNAIVKIRSAQCTTYQLKNSGDIFYRLCKSRAARQWLERAVRQGKAVYLVVGLKTLTDARVDVDEGSRVGVEGRVEAPVSLGAASAGILIPLDLDAGAEVSQLKEKGKITEFIAPGEQIYAVQYRKVKFTHFASRDVDKAFLESGNRWKVYLGTRGGSAAQVKDIVDAELGQDDSVKNHEDCEIFCFGSDKVLYFP